MVQGASLDSLAALESVSIDVLKIDVDGFDGKVLAGAVETLHRCRPSVLFEWHPKSIAATRNDPLCAFETLAHADMIDSSGSTILELLVILAGRTHQTSSKSKDITYSLLIRGPMSTSIALHHDAKLNEVELAQMDFARSVLSPRDRKRYN